MLAEHMVFLLYIFSSVLPAQALAAKRNWDCQISAHLTGSGQHYLYYGRDAWNGDGTLNCASGAMNVSRKVAVSFNSMLDGFGADRNSSVQMLLDLNTRMNPNELQIRAMVNDLVSGEKVQWAFASGLNEADVYITHATPSQAMRSLQRGTIFIRSSGE